VIGLLQRVQHARVEVDGGVVGEINKGLLVLLGVQPEDDETKAQQLIERLLHYRVFSDDKGRMNLSLLDISGELLLVPQFTLAADTRKGRRPSFATAAPPEQAERLFDTAVEIASAFPVAVCTGSFGADMQVSLCNDGPVTFWLEV